MDQLARWAVGLCAASLLVVGCQPAEIADVEDGDVAEARQAQCPTDPDKAFTHYYFEIDDNPFVDLLVIGDQAIGGFQADTEYWYVHTDALADLGNKDIVVTSTSGDENPPSLSGDQEFTQPVYLTWQSFSTDPVGVGELYSNAADTHHLRIKVESGEITRLVWYQILGNQSPANVAPDGTYEAVGGSVSVPSGYYGYHVDATIE